MKHLIFPEDIYDGDTLVWRSNTEYTVTKETDELFYVTSENNSESFAVEKKSEGSLFDIVEAEY